VVWDPYFENLVNKDREINISGIIYRITEVGVFFYTGNETKPKMDSVEAAWRRQFAQNGRTAIACAGTPILIDDSIQYLPGGDCSGGLWGSYYWGNWSWGSGGGGPIAPPPPGPCGLSSNTVTHNGSATNIFGVNHAKTLYLTGTTDRRIKAKFWAQNYVIFSSAGCKTKSQNKWAGIWWAENADRIYLNFEGEIQQKDVFGNYWTFQVASQPPQDESNQNNLSEIFEWTTAIVGNACDPVTGKCKPKFKAASPFKIQRLQTCHYVSDEGRHGEIDMMYQ